MFHRIIIFLFCFFAFRADAQPAVRMLKDQQEFTALSGLPLSSKYGNISSVKVVYDLRTNMLHFINSRQYKYHYEFCMEKLGAPDDLYQFNVDNYNNSPERLFLLGNVNYSQTLNKYFLELSAYDQMSDEHIRTLYKVVSENSFIGKKLFFLLNTARLLDRRKALEPMLPILLPEEIYRDISFQAVSKGKAYGKLRFVSDLDSLDSPLQETDIIVLKSTPVYLPMVAGIIVTEFQTPLSHLSILGQNRKIPVCAYKFAFRDQALTDLDKRFIQFEVTSDTFLISLNKYIAPGRKKKAIYLKKDLEADSLVDVKYLHLKAADFAGNKAANFGMLNLLSKNSRFKVPEGAFAIPFYFYEKHLERTRIPALIAKAGDHLSQPDTLKGLLKTIRAEIMKIRLDPELLRAVENKLRESGFKTFRFRSSTNAEDADGFSGAGLYESKTVILDDKDKTAAKAILKVWASLWNFEAYMERAYFGINQASASMGILVHRSFPDEAVNGVAITKNIYRDGYEGFVVNAQLGDVSVVDPPEGVHCDQFICSPKNLNSSFLNTVEVITFSSLNKSKLVMSESEIEILAGELEAIKRYYWPRAKNRPLAYEEFGLDIEFKLDKNTRQLYIKQVRIYNQ